VQNNIKADNAVFLYPDSTAANIELYIAFVEPLQV